MESLLKVILLLKGSTVHMILWVSLEGQTKKHFLVLSGRTCFSETAPTA